MKLLYTVCILTGVLCSGLTAGSLPTLEEIYEGEGEVDYVSLAALMIRDGHFDRAEAALKEVDPESKTVNWGMYWTVKGLLALRQADYEHARNFFIKAIVNGQSDKILDLYLAQAYFGLENYKATLATLKRAWDKAATMPDLYSIKLQCHWKLKQYDMAFAVLDEAEKKFPGDFSFIRQRILYLIELGLYREAVDLSSEFLKQNGDRAVVYLSLGEALRRSGRPDEAVLILEMARIKFPENATVLVSLAHSYIDRGSLRTGARLLEEAALFREKYLPEAIEIYRRAGELQRALFLNAELTDQKLKTRQRLGILIEMEKYAEAAALESRLSRLDLLSDQDIRYGLAYVKFRVGDFDGAEALLKDISDPALFNNVTKLMKAIDVYRQTEWFLP